MLKKIFGLMLVFALVVPVVSSAMDMTGKWGLGYFSSDAPVGVRYWVNEKVGVDVGLGFDNTDLGDESAMSFWFEIGAPYVLMGTERANFFFRPGLVYASLDDRVYGSGTLDDTWTNITIKLTPGAEVFFGEHFSLEAAHGITIDLMSPPGDGDSSTNFGTGAYSITQLGFHFYFK